MDTSVAKMIELRRGRKFFSLQKPHRCPRRHARRRLCQHPKPHSVFVAHRGRTHWPRKALIDVPQRFAHQGSCGDAQLRRARHRQTDMVARFLAPVLSALVALPACRADLRSASTGDPEAARCMVAELCDAGARGVGEGEDDRTADDSSDGGGSDSSGPGAGPDEAPGDDVGDAPDDDGSDNGTPGDSNDPDDAEEPPGPAPAQAGQACQEWTDCGPWYQNDNSGFDCVQGTCICNADGNWDDACASIGGVWSDEDCFCFVGASSMPTEDADTWLADDEDDDFYDDDGAEDPRANRQCWWRWKERCEPDRWVDTSDYEYVCDSGGDCDWEYDPSGYWESGDCSGYWIRRCDDGTEKRYGS